MSSSDVGDQGGEIGEAGEIGGAGEIGEADEVEAPAAKPSRQEFSRDQLSKLGAFIRDQRTNARLSLRQLSELANVSNPYLSQIERGMHEPSVRVLKAIAAGLDLSADVLLAEAGLLERVSGRGQAQGDTPLGVEAAIDADPMLSAEQKAALLSVYRSFVTSRSS